MPRAIRAICDSMSPFIAWCCTCRAPPHTHTRPATPHRAIEGPRGGRLGTAAAAAAARGAQRQRRRRQRDVRARSPAAASGASRAALAASS
eukprot:6988836-Prymnesium_polylepis.1